MSHEKQIALYCQISRGGFSGERIVLLTGADGKQRRGLAPRDYCWKRDGSPLKLEEPEEGAMAGLVAAQRIRNLEGGSSFVTIPDGTALTVSADTITSRPSSEFASHVPFGP